MMEQLDRGMPPVLRDLNRMEFDYADGAGIDFEPYDEFLSEVDTQKWIRAWTGNSALTAEEYRVFGQDGTGGYVAFWCVRSEAPVLQQPIVFFGSEGAVGVLASDFSDYLWLLAGGFGPFEALTYSESERPSNQAFTAFARLHSGESQKSAAEVLSKARAEFPDFEEEIRSACR
jgi:hypothetical protein